MAPGRCRHRSRCRRSSPRHRRATATAAAAQSAFVQRPTMSLRTRRALRELRAPRHLFLPGAIAQPQRALDEVAFDRAFELLARGAITGLGEEHEAQLVAFEFRHTQRDLLAATFGDAVEHLEALLEFEFPVCRLYARGGLRLPAPGDFGRHGPAIYIALAGVAHFLLGHVERTHFVGMPFAHVVVVRDHARAGL